jgi:hypothetical protein
MRKPQPEIDCARKVPFGHLVYKQQKVVLDPLHYKPVRRDKRWLERIGRIVEAKGFYPGIKLLCAQFFLKIRKTE